MKIQISSGRGPAECELAVAGFYKILQKEYPEIEILSCSNGKYADTYQSILLHIDKDLSELEGSILWKCKSPYRKNCKRKNWYIDVSILKESKSLEYNNVSDSIRFETFRSSGKGGQHVNKVETGIRLIHIPTGIIVESTTARSQHQNKQIALNRLCEIMAEAKIEMEKQEDKLAWMEHDRIMRGNPIRIYEGMDWKRSFINSCVWNEKSANRH